jgi:CheY-like chemotaxis protein
VNSIEGKGSNFWIDIPLIKPSKNQIFSTIPQTNYKSILIGSVDESLINNLKIVSLFMGFNVIKTCTDLKKCLEYVKDETFDVLVIEDFFYDCIGSDAESSKIIILGDRYDHESGEDNSTDTYFSFLPSPFLISKFIQLVKCEETKKKKKSDLAGMSILVVEDHSLIRKTICKLLQKLNASNISSAENGIEAIEIIQKEKPFDVILMDIQMPMMNGVEASHRKSILNSKFIVDIRSLPDFKKANVPIIAVTGNFVSSKEKQLKEWKMNEILIKPVKIENLIKTILDILKN